MSIVVPLQTITETIHRRICPLYTFDKKGKPYLTGSAVPFSSGGNSFLVTAAHVCLTSQKRGVPLFTWGLERPRVLNGTRLMWEAKNGQPLISDIDIALISLSKEEEIDLKKAYLFSDPSTTTKTKDQEPGVHYLIAGYPSIRNKARWNSLPSSATHLITGKIIPVEIFGLENKWNQLHFALSFKGDTICKSDGTIFPIPIPQGMSGGGIWRLDINSKSKMATIPLLVGIGIEFHKSQCIFVGSKIQNTIPLVHDLVKLMSGDQPSDVLEDKIDVRFG